MELSSSVDFETADQRLLTAVKQNRLADAKRAIEAGADVNFQDELKATILMWASFKTDLPFMKFLVEQGADHERKGQILIGMTGYYGSLMAIAAGEERKDLLTYFLDDLCIDVDDLEFEVSGRPGWSALQWAIAKNNLDIVNFLLQRGANPNPTYFRGTCLQAAMRNDNVEMFNVLIDSGADVNRIKSESPLHAACRKRRIDFAKILLHRGANPNARNADSGLSGGIVPLMIAAGHSFLGHCKLLVDSGADPNARSNQGQTVLDFAIDTEVIEYLEGVATT